MRCKVCDSDAWVRNIIVTGYVEGKSVRDISYFLKLFLNRRIGKDTLYHHFKQHDTDSYQLRTVFLQMRASKNKRTYPKKPDPMKILEAMNR